MKAAIYHQFKHPIQLETIADPACSPSGVMIQVKATGICRSDWWGWQGNDSDIQLPHVPGHELAGIIVEAGSQVKKWKRGDRVTVPFVGGCGKCGYCKSGNQQVCDHQFQPGFTAWGSFAEYVFIDYADENLVRIPEGMSFIDAASLGCRFITAFRAIVHQARIKDNEWLAIHGCGGVGLSALLIGKALGANVIAVDVSINKLEFALTLGADLSINAQSCSNVLEEIHAHTNGGAHVSMDALGLKETCLQSILSLRKRGRHIQVGLLEGDQPEIPLPMNLIIGKELEIYGSHGMQASKYHEIYSLINQGKLDPGKLVTDVLDLEKGIDILMHMDESPPLGIGVIEMS
jgi:alcohol dehydrogenase